MSPYLLFFISNPFCLIYPIASLIFLLPYDKAHSILALSPHHPFLSDKIMNTINFVDVLISSFFTFYFFRYPPLLPIKFSQ